MFLSLHPIDIGFSLKDTETPVILPEDEILEVKFLDKNNDINRIIGEKPIVKRTLELNGYIVK